MYFTHTTLTLTISPLWATEPKVEREREPGGSASPEEKPK